MSLGVEAVWVGLHDVNSWARGVSIFLGCMSALATGLDQVDTCDTAAVVCAQVNVIRDAAASHIRLERVTDQVVSHLVLEEDSVV